MIKFIELNSEFEFKWEYKYEEQSHYGFNTEHSYTYNYTGYNSVKLKGVDLVEWLQIYGFTPDEMFKGTNIHPYGKTTEEFIDRYDLYKAANEWKEKNEENIKNHPWTVIAMNGGYVLLSNGSKENTVELGSASIMNLEMNNSNTNAIKNDPKISIQARASLI